ncbi:MAG: VOC family protein [Bacteroidetes bacterium]|nr:VOC family protein [Bacteroidota bacterium]
MLINFPPAVPEIPVSDLPKALAYYKNNLGFDIDWGEEGGHIAGISKGDCRIFLTDAPFRQRYQNISPVLIWFNLNSKEQVDELYTIWNSSQVKIISPPESKPWKLHEFTASDPDGNLFRVFYDFS